MKIVQFILGLFLLTILISCNEIDNRGFDIKTKIHSYTKTQYDLSGYDYDGYDKNGFNYVGYDKNGYGKDGFNRNGFDRNGYGENGFDKEGYNRNGWSKDGLNRETNTKYDKNGYDVNNTDINGNLNLSNLTDRKSDDVFNIQWDIYELTKVDNVLVKGEFEKSDQFNKRKLESDTKKNKLIEEYSKRIYVYNYSQKYGYDADREMWNFIIQNIEIYKEESEGKKEVFIDGEFIDVLKFRNTTMILEFSNPKTINIPMDIDKAKNHNGFSVQIIYKLNNVSEKTVESLDFNQIMPTKARPADVKEIKEKIKVKCLGINIWDIDRKNLIYSKLPNN